VTTDAATKAPSKPHHRLAVVTTHPIQYYAPWFRYIAQQPDIELRVFYLWNPATTSLRDPGFGQEIAWDVPLLEGYHYEFVPNASPSPGSSSFNGMDNPDIISRLNLFHPDAALLIGYRYRTMQRLIFSRARNFPLLLRGDSHRLVGKRNDWLAPMRRFAISRIFRRFAAMLYVGKANLQYYRMHGVPENRLFFSPHAIDNDRFSLTDQLMLEGKAWKAELGIRKESLLVLFAGKFEPKKRPLDLLHALSRLKLPNVALVFVGAGIFEAALREAATGMEDIFFAPFQNQSLMPRTYTAADLFVLPSFGKDETWGLAINEALCAARPVIASSHVGCGPDLIVPGVNGLIFEAGNADSLEKALRDALSSKDRLIRWGREGQRIVSRYDYFHATAGLREALGSVCSDCATVS
jgi:glycosyltransferase involved in cell wall biosynthesis